MNTGAPAEGAAAKNDQWPRLTLSAWQETREALQLWFQVVGKVRLALEPMVNHWWQVPLYVSSRGLTSSLMHTDSRVRWRSSSTSSEHTLRCSLYGGIGTTTSSSDRDRWPPSTPRPWQRCPSWGWSTRSTTVQSRWSRPSRSATTTAPGLRARSRGAFLARADPGGSGDEALPREVHREGESRCTSSGAQRTSRPRGSRPSCTTASWRRTELSGLGATTGVQPSAVELWVLAGGSSEGSFYSYAYPQPVGFSEARVGPDAAYYDKILGNSLSRTPRYGRRRIPTPCSCGSCRAPTRLRLISPAGTVPHWRCSDDRAIDGSGLSLNSGSWQ